MEQIHHYQRLLELIIEQERLLGQVEDKQDKFEEVYRPALFFRSHRFNDTYQKDEDPNELPDISDMLAAQPFAKPTFMISSADIDRPPDYRWGFSITQEKAYEIKRDITDPALNAKYYAPCKCLYSVFEAYGRGTFAECVYQQVLKPLLAQGKTICGDLIGRLIARVHDEDRFVRYFEIWVPIEE